MPKRQNDSERDARLNLTIREELLLAFKIQAVKERTSMAELAERIIEEYLKKAEK